MRCLPGFRAALTLLVLACGATGAALAGRSLQGTPRDLNPEFRNAREGSYGQDWTGAERPEATFPAICKHPLFVGGGCF
jgi:hypothetical protein